MFAAISSGELWVWPSTAKAPALITAAATSLQCVNATIGYSIPSDSQSWVCSGSLRTIDLLGGRRVHEGAVLAGFAEDSKATVAGKYRQVT